MEEPTKIQAKISVEVTGNRKRKPSGLFWTEYTPEGARMSPLLTFVYAVALFAMIVGAIGMIVSVFFVSRLEVSANILGYSAIAFTVGGCVALMMSLGRSVKWMNRYTQGNDGPGW